MLAHDDTTHYRPPASSYYRLDTYCFRRFQEHCLICAFDVPAAAASTLHDASVIAPELAFSYYCLPGYLRTARLSRRRHNFDEGTSAT